MKCVNLNLKLSLPSNNKYSGISMQEAYENTVEAMASDDAATALFGANNGYPLHVAPNGSPSELYSRLDYLHEGQAINLKASTYTPEFAKSFGDWINNGQDLGVLDTNGEPKVLSSNGVHFYKGKDGNPIPTVQGNDLSGIDFNTNPPTGVSIGTVMESDASISVDASNSELLKAYGSLSAYSDLYGVVSGNKSDRVGTGFTTSDNYVGDALRFVAERKAQLTDLDERADLDRGIRSLKVALIPYSKTDPDVEALLNGITHLGFSHIAEAVTNKRLMRTLGSISVSLGVTMYDKYKSTLLFALPNELKNNQETSAIYDKAFKPESVRFESKRIPKKFGSSRKAGFPITTKKGKAEKDKYKAQYATVYTMALNVGDKVINYPKGSSTKSYAFQATDKGVKFGTAYLSGDDVVFLSTSGDPSATELNLEANKIILDEIVSVGAAVLMDSFTQASNNSYVDGPYSELANILYIKSKGYVEVPFADGRVSAYVLPGDVANIEAHLGIKAKAKTSTKAVDFKEGSMKVTYTPKGKAPQTYYVKGTHIYNTSGKEVFAKDSKDRLSIFAKLSVIKGNSVVIEYTPKGAKRASQYIVNKRGDIFSVTTKSIVYADPNHGVGKAIRALAEDKLSKLSKAKSSGAASNFTNYSGGAKGADAVWASIGKQFGIGKQVDYTVKDYHELPKKEKSAVDKKYKAAVQFLGRSPIKEGTYVGNLVRRDIMQADSADAVYGVTELVAPGVTGRKGYKNNTDHPVPEGGTGYAIAHSILSDKPTYVFNQSAKYGYPVGWYKWSVADNKFIQTATPTLTEKFAGIGTQSINDAGKAAIREAYTKTFSPKYKSSSTIWNSALQDKADTAEFDTSTNEFLTIPSNKRIQEVRNIAPGTPVEIGEGSVLSFESSDVAFYADDIIGALDKSNLGTIMHTNPYNKKKGEIKAMYLMTKTITKDVERLLKQPIPRFLYVSITGMGGTNVEPGVLPWFDSLKQIEKVIKAGMNPDDIVIRIDPIYPGRNSPDTAAGERVIRSIVREAHRLGIKQVVTSVFDIYASTPKSLKDSLRASGAYSGNSMHANKDYLSSTFQSIQDILDEESNGEIEQILCGEHPSVMPKKSRHIGCLNTERLEKTIGSPLTGVKDRTVEDVAKKKDAAQRNNCLCAVTSKGKKIKAQGLTKKQKCKHCCVGCYVGKQSEAMKWKDNKSKLDIKPLDLSPDSTKIAPTIRQFPFDKISHIAQTDSPYTTGKDGKEYVYGMRMYHSSEENNPNRNKSFGNPFTGSGVKNAIPVGRYKDKSYDWFKSRPKQHKEAQVDASKAYYSWLKGTDYKNVKPDQRKWILDEIDSGRLDTATFVYMLGNHQSHVQMLTKFIEERRGKVKKATDTTKGKQGQGASPDEIEALYKSLQTEAPISDEPGTIINYRYKKEDKTWGTSKLMLGKDAKGKLVGFPLRSYSKIAVYDVDLSKVEGNATIMPISEVSYKGKVRKFLVLSPTKVIEVGTTKVLDTGSELFSMVTVVTLAKAISTTKEEPKKSTKKWNFDSSKKYNIGSKSKGIFYALTNPTITNPKKKDGKTVKWKDGYFKGRGDGGQVDYFRKMFVERGFMFKGVRYADVEEAYQANKEDYPIPTQVELELPDGTVTTMSARDAFMANLQYLKFQQYPEIFNIVKDKMVTAAGGADALFDALTHNVTDKAGRHWESPKSGKKGRNNAFIKALKLAYQQMESTYIERSGSTIVNVSKEELADIATGKSIVLKSPLDLKQFSYVRVEADGLNAFVQVYSKTEDGNYYVRLDNPWLVTSYVESLNVYSEDSNNAALAKDLAKALKDTGKEFEGTKFAKDIVDALSHINDTSYSEALRSISESDELTAHTLVHTTVNGTDAYIDELVEVIHKMQSYYEDAPGESSSVGVPTEDVLGVVIEDDDGLSSILESIKSKEHKYYAVIDELKGDKYYKDVVEHLTKLGATVIPDKEQGITYYAIPTSSAKSLKVGETIISKNGINTTNTPEGKVVVSLGNVEEVTTAKKKVATVTTKNTIKAIKNLIKVANSRPKQVFYVKSRNKSFLSKLIRQSTLPDNIVFDESMRDYVLSEFTRHRAELSKKALKVNRIKMGKYNIDLKAMGITFALSDEQEKTLQRFALWVEDTDDTSAFTVEGLAGTGKTTIIRIMNRYMGLADKKREFLGSTHVAAINMEMIIGEVANTVHSGFSIAPSGLNTFDETQLEYDKMKKSDALFIDETSMLSNELTDSIMEFGNVTKTKIVFFGNNSQLENIDGGKNTSFVDPSKVLFNRLTEVKRQNAGNPALPLYTLFATNQSEGYRNDGLLVDVLFDEKTGNGYKMETSGKQFMEDIIQKFMDNRNNPMAVRVLTYRNKQVDAINKAVRARLVPRHNETVLTVGELVIPNVIISEFRKNLQYRVTEATEQSKEIITNGVKVSVPTVKVVLESGVAYRLNNGEEGVPPMDIEIVDTSKIDMSQVNVEGTPAWIIHQHHLKLEELRSDIRRAFGKEKKQLLSVYNEVINLLPLMKPYIVKKKTRGGKEYPFTSIPAHFSHSYATTVHASQGLEFDEVFIDEKDSYHTIDWYRGKQKSLAEQQSYYRLYNKLMYVGLTRARRKATGLVQERRLKKGSLAKPRTTFDIKYLESEGILEKSKTRLQEKIAKRNEGAVFESKKIVRNQQYGRPSKTATTLEEFMQKKGIAGKYIPAHLKSNTEFSTPQEEALFKVAPYDSTYNDPGIPGLQGALDTLNANLAISEDDSRIPVDMDMDTYNLTVYDKYQREVMRAMYDEAFGKSYNKVAFELRVSSVRSYLEEEISHLTDKVRAYKLHEMPGSDIVALERNITRVSNRIKAIRNMSGMEYLQSLAASELQEVRDILAKHSPSLEDSERANRILKTWISVGDYSHPAANPFLDEADLSDGTVRKAFTDIANAAADLKLETDKLNADVLTTEISRELGTEFKFSDILSLNGKVGQVFKWIFSTAKINSPLIGYITKIVNFANNKAVTQALKDSKHLAELHKAAEDSGFDTSLLYQRNRGGAITGRLISAYSSEYNKKLNVPESSPNYLINLRSNSVIIDTGRLLRFGRKTYAAELAQDGTLSEEKINAALDLAESRYKEFSSKRKKYMKDMFGTKNKDKLTLEQRRTLKAFDKMYDPVARAKEYKDVTLEYKKDFDTSIQGDQYVVIIPKEFIDTAEGTINPGYYDAAYATMLANPAAKALWEKAFEITKRSKDNFNSDDISEYALSSVEGDLIGAYRKGGTAEVTKAVNDNLINRFTTKTKHLEYDVDSDDRKIKRNSNTLEDAINKEFKRIIREDYFNKDIEAATYEAIYTEASNNVTKDMKLDIFSALNNLHYSSMTYAYKSAIMPQINLALQYVSSIVADRGSDPRIGSVSKKDIANATDMLDYFLDKELYDIKEKDTTYKISGVILDSKDKARRDQIEEHLLEIDNLISDLETEIYATEPDTTQYHLLNSRLGGLKNYREKYEEELETLGGKVTLGKVVDSMVDYMRLLTIGWNMSGFIANLAMGMYSNAIHAAGAQAYNFSDLIRAGRATVSENEKFNAVMHNYNILGDVLETYHNPELFKKDGTTLDKIKEFADPFFGMTLTEKYNQGTLAIAVMMGTKVTDTETGEMIPFWDAIDADGTLSDRYEYKGARGSDAINTIIPVITENIAVAHGDYKNPVMAAGNAYGRAVIQFKRYFFEPFLARFGAERENYQTGYTTKGIYVSMFNMLKSYGINYSRFKADMANGVVAEIDLVNFRKALAELTAIVVASAIAKLSSSLLCQEDDSNCGPLGSWLVNLLYRIEGETKTFVNPYAWKNFVSNPAAIANYLDILEDIGNNIESNVNGKDAANPLYYTISRTLPMANSIRREALYTEKIIFND